MFSPEVLILSRSIQSDGRTKNDLFFKYLFSIINYFCYFFKHSVHTHFILAFRSRFRPHLVYEGIFLVLFLHY